MRKCRGLGRQIAFGRLERTGHGRCVEGGDFGDLCCRKQKLVMVEEQTKIKRVLGRVQVDEGRGGASRVLLETVLQLSGFFC
jgi:hypothetical protein